MRRPGCTQRQQRSGSSAAAAAQRQGEGKESRGGVACGECVRGRLAPAAEAKEDEDEQQLGRGVRRWGARRAVWWVVLGGEARGRREGCGLWLWFVGCGLWVVVVVWEGGWWWW